MRTQNQTIAKNILEQYQVPHSQFLIFQHRTTMKNFETRAILQDSPPFCGFFQQPEPMAERLKVAGTVTTMKNFKILAYRLLGLDSKIQAPMPLGQKQKNFNMKFGQTQIENWEYIMVLLLPRPVTFPTVSHDFQMRTAHFFWNTMTSTLEPIPVWFWKTVSCFLVNNLHSYQVFLNVFAGLGMTVRYTEH